MRTPVLFSMLGLSLFACRSDNNTTVDAPGGTVDAPLGGAVHIQDIQNNAMPPGTAVSLSGVIVTAIDTFGAKTGDIWVEEPGGGPFSGVHVYGAPVAMVSGLAVGDIVSIGGALKDEFALPADTSGRTVTELKAGPSGMKIMKTGTGTVPAPMVVDALAIGQMSTQAARDVEWEKWEGVLIKLNNVAQTGSLKQIGGATPDPTLQSFPITGVAKAESSLAAFPTGTGLGTCFASMTGVVDYFFDYLVLPRSTAEAMTGGTGCPAAEAAAGTTIGTCGDGIDNDGNGFADCADLGCGVGANAWLGATCTASDTMCGCSANLPTNSVTALNTAATLPTTPVLLHNVFVTGASTRGIWVADSLTAAGNGGMFVFGTVTPLPTIGQKLATLQGTVSAFNPSKLTTGFQTQIEVGKATPGGATAGGTPTPLTLAASVVGDLANGKQYAGSLVKLSTVAKVKAISTLFNQVTLVDNNNVTITMDDDAFPNYGGATSTPPAVGTCLTVTGVMDVQTTDMAGMMEVRTINPRSAADLAAGSNCTGV